MPIHPRRAPAALALGLLALAVSSGGCGKPPTPLAPPDAPTVSVRHPAMTNYAPTKEFVGRLVTKDPVKVIPQVSGMVLRRAFQEGSLVEKDKTLLFEIDRVQFEADLSKAKADVAKAEADIKNWTAQTKLAEVELARAEESYRRGATAKNDVDKAVANLDVTKAQIDVSKASKGSALAAESKAAENLRYCTILAPTNGRTRQALVAEKAIVDAYKTELVEISPTDEIYAVFEVDELTSLWYRNEIYEKKEIPNPKNKDTPLRCWITLKDGRTYPPPGQPGQPIDFYDTVIERATGTRTIRATFPNPDGRLSGGDSVRVRSEAGRPRQVLTIPETAVFAQQRKRYVYVVATSPEGDKAELREVEPGVSFDGLVVIDKGLTTADRVIVDNLLRVRPGVKVQIQQ
jgi:RND family efflux transporter MFP subunit